MERASRETIASVAVGLIGPELWLHGSVLVKVPVHRRDRFGSPSAILAAVVHGPLIDGGVLGVWALSGAYRTTFSLNAAACEFSRWPLPRGAQGVTTTTQLIMAYPEVIAAELGALSLEAEVAF